MNDLSIKIGWGIIALLLAMFALNIFLIIGIEWDTIKGVFLAIKESICK